MSRSNSFVRIPALAIRQRIRPLPRIGVLDEDLLSLRVWPQDIDFNLHLNNARYLSFMDYGRVHLMAATGILTPAIQQRWAPLVGSISVTYRRSLGLFAPFTLTTRLLCWDEKWLYMEQVFEAESRQSKSGYAGSGQDRSGQVRNGQAGNGQVNSGQVKSGQSEGGQSRGGLASIAWVKGLFRGAQGNIPSQQVIDMVAPGVVSPPVPESLLQWNALTREKLASGE